MENIFSTADLCDRFLDAPSGLQVVAPGLRSYGGRAAYWGQIATVAPASPGGAVRLREVLAEPGHGRVLVVEGHADDRWAVLGDQLAALGHGNGWAGVVLHGYVRDVRALAGIDFGVHALGSTPARPRAFDAVERECAVNFHRARFSPGNWLYADEDGIVVRAKSQGAARDASIPETSGRDS